MEVLIYLMSFVNKFLVLILNVEAVGKTPCVRGGGGSKLLDDIE